MGRSLRSIAVRRYVAKVVTYAILAFFVFIFLMPFIWMVFASLKSFKDLNTSRQLLPQVWTVANYLEIWNSTSLQRAILNNLILVTSIVLLNLFFAGPLGYIFAKYQFKGKQILFIIFLATMMIPGTVTLIPLYLRIKDLGLMNTLTALIVASMINTFGVFLLRQFIEQVPSALVDAATIDGAGEWTIYYRIINPLVLAPLSALAIMVFLAQWDNWLLPSIILSSDSKKTLAVVLQGLRSLFLVRYELWSAASMFTVVPVLLLYAFLSRHFIRGLALTGIKQ